MFKKNQCLVSLLILILSVIYPAKTSADATSDLVLASSQAIVALGKKVDRALGTATSIFDEMNKNAGVNFTPHGMQTHGATLRMVEWHPTGTYLAAAGDPSTYENTSLRLYKLNKTTETCIEITAFGITQTLSTILSMAWSSDGRLLAIGNDQSQIFVYAFAEDINGSLSLITTLTQSNNAQALSWRIDGSILAASDGTTARIYQLKLVNKVQTLLQIATYNHTYSITSLDWSADNKYLAIGGGTIARLTSIAYSSGTWILSSISTYDHLHTINDIRWHPISNILAIAGTTTSLLSAGLNGLNLISVEGDNEIDVQSVDWKHSGDQFTVAGKIGSSVALYKFNGHSAQLQRNARLDDGDGIAHAVRWQPFGDFFALAHDVGSQGYSLRFFKSVINTNNYFLVPGTSITADHGEQVIRVAWHPNGQYLIVAGEINSNINAVETTMRLFKYDQTVATLTEVKSARIDHGAMILDAKWSPSGQFLAIGGFNFHNCTVRIFEFDITDQTFEYLPACDYFHGGTWIYGVDWSQDGRFLAIGGDKVNNITHRVLEFDRYARTMTNLTGTQMNHGAEIDSVHWSPDGKYLAVGGQRAGTTTHRIYRFDPTAKTLTVLPNAKADHGANIRSVAWSPDAGYLAVTGARSSNITHRIYNFNFNTETLTELTTAQSDHGDYVSQAFWSSDSKYVAIGGNRNKNIASTYATHRIYQFNRQAGTLTEVSAFRQDHTDNIATVAFSPDHRLLAAAGHRVNGSLSLRVHQINVTAQNLVEQPGGRVSHGTSVHSVDWSPNGLYLATGGDRINSVGIHVYNYDPDNGKLTELPRCQADHGSNVRVVRWSPDGNFLAVGGDRNNSIGSIYTTTRVFQLNLTTESLVELSYCRKDHGADVYALSWRTSRNDLAVGGVSSNSITHRVYSFDAPSLSLQEQASAQSNHGATIYALEWAPDDIHLAMGGDRTSNLTHRIYEYNSQAQTLTNLSGCAQDHGNSIKSVSWNTDSTRLLVGGLRSSNITSRVYIFNHSTEILTECTFARQDHGADIKDVQWNNDNRSYAACGLRTNSISHRIYSFDKDNLISTEVTSAQSDHGANLETLSWHTNKIDLATGGNLISNLTSRVYSYTPASAFPISVDMGNHALAVAWHQDGQYIAFGGTINGTTTHRIYKIDYVNQVLNPIVTANHGSTVLSIAWRPGPGYYFATSSTTNKGNSPPAIKIYQFDPNARLIIPIASAISYDVNSVSWSSDGTYLAAGGLSQNGQSTYIYKFDPIAAQLTLLNAQDHGSEVKSVSIHPSGNYVVAVGVSNNNTTLRIYSFDPSPGILTEITSMRFDHGGTMYTATWSPSGQYLITGGTSVNGVSTRVFAFDQTINSLLELPSCRANHGTGYSILGSQWSHDEKLIAICGERNATIDNQAVSTRIYAFDNKLMSLTERKELRIDNGGNTHAVDFNPLDYYFTTAYDRNNSLTHSIYQLIQDYTSTNANGIVTLDGSGLSLTNPKSTPQLFPLISDIACSPVDDYIAATGYKTTRLFSFNQFDSITPFQQLSTALHDNIITDLSWHPYGKCIAIGGRRGLSQTTVRIYRINATNQLIQKVIADHGANVLAVAWRPDGNYLAIAGDQNGAITTRIYYFYYDGTQWALDELPNSQVNHGASVYSLAWSQDGQYLASGGAVYNSITTRIYQFTPSTGTLAEIINANNTSTVYSVGWNPNTQYHLATGGVRSGGITSRLYAFDGTNLTEYTDGQVDHGSDVTFIEWQPINSTLVMGGNAGNAGREISSFNFNITTSSLSLTNLQGNFGCARDGSWRFDGSYFIEVLPVGNTQSMLYPNPTNINLNNTPDSNANYSHGAGINLYTNNTLDFTVSISLNGNGQIINFPDDKGLYFFIDPNTSVTLSNFTFNNFKTQNIFIAPGGTLTINGGRIKLGDNETIMNNIYTIGNVNFDGQDYELKFSSSNYLSVAASSTLRLNNIRLNKFNNSSLAVGNEARIIFDNAQIMLSQDTNFPNGFFDIVRHVSIDGPYTFTYSSNLPNTIKSNSILTIKPGTTFRYDPISQADNLLKFQDQSAELFLDGGTLESPDSNIHLWGGSLVSEKIASLKIGTGYHLQVGDGTQPNNLLVTLNYGILDLVQGELLYNNIDT